MIKVERMENGYMIEMDGANGDLIEEIAHAAAAYHVRAIKEFRKKHGDLDVKHAIRSSVDLFGIVMEGAMRLPGAGAQFEYVFNVIAMYPELRGSKAYMIWNDACDRDVLKAYKVFVAICNGWLPMETVRAHLAEGWCAPFKPEEYVEGRCRV